MAGLLSFLLATKARKYLILLAHKSLSEAIVPTPLPERSVAGLPRAPQWHFCSHFQEVKMCAIAEKPEPAITGPQPVLSKWSCDVLQ